MWQNPSKSHLHSLSHTQLMLLLRCGFVNFKDRESAEKAAQAWANGLDFEDGTRASVKWGRSRAAKAGTPAAPTVEAQAS
jgi:pre-mRNA-splicing factor RBM22/SLT11